MPYVFVVDNHPQSNDREGGSGFSSLDQLKYVCEVLEKELRRAHQSYFEKVSSSNAGEGSRQQMDFSLMLVGSEGHRSCLKAQSTDPHAVFYERLKNMTALDEASQHAAPYDLSNALSNTFSTLNKMRMRSKVDNFGCGRNPSALEPAVVFVVTDGRYVADGTTISLSKGMPSTGSDFYADPFRWDQRIYPIVVGSGDGCSSSNSSSSSSSGGVSIPADLQALAAATGGQALSLSGICEATDKMKWLASKLVHTNIVVQLTSKHFMLHNTAAGGTGELSVPIKLCPVGKTKYPFPETFYVENCMDVVPARQAHPVLTLMLEGRGSSGAAELGLARTLGIHIDSYEVARARQLSLSSTLQSLGLKRDSVCMLFISGSHRPSDAHSSATAHDPCAIIGPGRTSSGAQCTKLYVLPYNFTCLLPVLKEAFELQKAAAATPGGTVGITSSIRQNLTSYLWALPGYYYSIFTDLCKQFHIAGVVNIPQLSMYSRGVERRLERLQHMAAHDVANLDKALRESWPRLPLDPFAMISHQKYVADRKDWTKLDADFSLEFPRNVKELRANELLTAWENMHSKIFGGHSLVSKGVAVNRRRGFIGFAPKTREETKQHAEEHWFSIGSGATMVQMRPVRDMSAYMEVLCRKEAPRETGLDAQPPLDEDESVGIFRRKVTVNFGNPFTKGKKKGNVNHLLGSGAAGGDLVGMGMVDESFDDVKREADALFADTPIPDNTSFGDMAVDAASLSVPHSVTSIPRLVGGTTQARKRKRSPSMSSERVASRTESDFVSLSSTPASSPTPSEVESAVGSVTPDMERTRRRDSPSSTPPPEQKQKQQEQQDQQQHVQATDTTGTTPEPPLPAGWVKQYSRSKKMPYWFNTETGQSLWTPPPGP